MRARAVSRILVAALLLLTLPAVAPAWQDDRDRGEIEQGREADRQIEAQFGFYDDEKLTAYVEGIGNRMAAMSERPHLPWTFRVLDSPVVNAFALPGGFVHVTRGLVAYAGNEAELAGVIGHEIGHVTGKHSQSRQRRSLFANLGLLAGAVFSETGRHPKRTRHPYDQRALQIEPARLAVTEAQRRMQLAGVIEEHPDVSVRPELVAILNHLSLQDLIESGDVVKLIFGGPGLP